jgi:ATP-dependent DNA helicase RecQ
LLHSLGKLTWLDPFTYSIIDRQFSVKFERFSPDMRGYLLTHHCRWQFLLTAFGFGAKGWRCGHCDNCQ